MLKTQLRFKSESQNVFTEQIKIALSLNINERTQSIDLIETYVSGTSKDLVNEEEEIKSKNIIKQHRMD